MSDTNKGLENIYSQIPIAHVPPWLRRVPLCFQDETKTLRKIEEKGLFQNVGLQTQKEHVPSWPKRARFIFCKFLWQETKWYVIIDHVPSWPKRDYRLKILCVFDF